MEHYFQLVGAHLLQPFKIDLSTFWVTNNHPDGIYLRFGDMFRTDFITPLANGTESVPLTPFVYYQSSTPTTSTYILGKFGSENAHITLAQLGGLLLAQTHDNPDLFSFSTGNLVFISPSPGVMRAVYCHRYYGTSPHNGYPAWHVDSFPIEIPETWPAHCRIFIPDHPRS